MSTTLRVFPAISRNRDPQKYVGELMRVAEFADRNGFAGILLFEGNDVFVEPWAMAQHIMSIWIWGKARSPLPQVFEPIA